MGKISKNKDTLTFAVLSQTTSLIAQQVALTTELRADLAHNPALSSDLWDEVYKVANYEENFDGYLSLLKTAPDSIRADRVLELTAPYPLSWGLASCAAKLSPAALQKVMSLANFNMALAAPLIASGVLPEDQVLFWMEHMLTRNEEFSLALTEIPLPFSDVLDGAISNYNVIPDALIVRALISQNRLWLRTRRNIDLRPSLIDALLAKMALRFIHHDRHISGLWVLKDLAISQHLTTKQTRLLLKIIASMLKDGICSEAAKTTLTWLLLNPSVSLFCKAKALTILPTIPLPREPAIKEGWTLEIKHSTDHATAELNSNLPRIRTTWDKAAPAQRHRVATTVKSFGISSYPTLAALYPATRVHSDKDQALNYEYVNNELSPMLDAAGPLAWEIFLATLPEWHSDIHDLAIVAVSTAVNH